MLVAHFSGIAQGGVGVAADRLHRGLLGLGVQSRLIYANGDCFSPFAERRKAATNYLLRHKADLTWGLRHRLCKPGAGLFTSPHGVRATPLSWFNIRPDIVDLHWLTRWVDVPSFFASLPSGLPMVLSLHEMNPFTGGCHLWSGCERFTTECHHCPKLRFSWRWDASARYFQAKKRAYQNHRLHVVGNSEWTTSRPGARRCFGTPFPLRRFRWEWTRRVHSGSERHCAGRIESSRCGLCHRFRMCGCVGSQQELQGIADGVAPITGQK